MLLKLIPGNSEPTIHFSLSFSDLPPQLPMPAAWSAQLTQLMLEDLEVPVTIHSLDKAAGLASLLEEVALDVGANEVRCRFVDGKVEKWGFWDGIVGIGPWKAMAGSLYGQRLLEALEGIMRDVKESTLEDERLAREKEWEKQKLERSRSLSTATAPKGILGKVSKHKKQRSFFMQIVSSIGSIINLTSPSAANHPAIPFSRSSVSTAPSVFPPSPPPTSSSNTSASPGTSARARALRRAARSALVDTYRLFVLSELLTRLQGYTESPDQQLVRSQEYQRKEKISFGVWILHSMRRRAMERMEQLLEEAEVEAKARGYIANVNQELDVGYFGMEPATTAVPLSFSDDEDEMEPPPPGLSSTEKDEDSDSDETDGSSLHTPSTTSHFQCYPGRPPFSRTSSTSSHSIDDSSSTSSDDNGKATRDAETKEDKLVAAQAQKSLPEIPQFQPTTSVLSASPRVMHHLSSASLHEYNRLVELRSRLGHLLLFAASQARVAADEAQSRLEILAVRSRRRAWSNKALSLTARSRAGLGGSAIYGLVTPFRSSSLARHMWKAEDFFQEPSSSTTPFLSNSLTRCSSRGFPSYRPRLRPKIQYDIETLAVEVDENPFGDDEDLAFAPEDHLQAAELDCEIYGDMGGPSDPSSLGGRTRQHIRGGNRKFTSARPAPGRSGIGRLFPVSEEMDGEVQDHFPDEDQAFEFAVHGRHHRAEKRTFMACEEVTLEDQEEDDEDCLEDPHELDVELGFGEFGSPEVPQNVGANGERISNKMSRPSISPRVRTTSMMGTFVQRTKQAQSDAFHAASHQSGPELTKDSLLCQPVAISVSNPSVRRVSPPKLQIQSSVRVKVGSPPKDIGKPIQVSAPAIYDGAEVDLELDLRVRVGDLTSDNVGYEQPHSQDGVPPLSIVMPKQQIVRPGAVAVPEGEEFTLAMDVLGEKRRSHSTGRHTYPTRPLSRHEFEGSRRPKLGSIFQEPQPTFAPKLSDVAP